METAAKVEAAVSPAGDETDRIVTLTASTDPHKALADIAQLRAESARRNTWRRAAQAALLLGAMLAGWLTPRFREHGLAAAPADAAPADSAAPALTEAQAAAPAPAPTPLAPAVEARETAQYEAQQLPEAEATAPADPAARCENDFKARTWRAAIESCSAAFDVTPSPSLAMRVAHARFSHGDTEGAGAWAGNALELGSTDPDAHLLIGHAELAAGKRRKAIAAYRQYLELAPRGWHAPRLRAVIAGKAETAS